ncbi:Imm50 family immunity protein [Streptomyces roseolus]|uniref:Imm50 family immunity protein n=1 Tax=Streptomyces roseolus TaxID=67358 RepID=UPI0036670035
MNASEWHTLLTATDEVREIFTDLPDLERCDLFFCHIDERDVSVTLGFDTRHVPAPVLEEPGEPGRAKANAFEFFLTFTSVTDLRISGWGGNTRRSVHIDRAPSSEGIAVSVESPTEHLSFRAREAVVPRARAYLAASPPSASAPSGAVTHTDG